MTDDNQEHQEQEHQQGKTFTEAEVQALIQKELAGIKANRDALLEEKKEQQRIASEAEAERLRIEKEAELEIARKNGDWQSIEADLRNQILERDNRILEIQGKHEQDIASRKSTEIASKLAKQAFLPYMTEDVKKRISRDESGVWRFKDKSGNMTAMTEEEFINDLRNDGRYEEFIVINNASGSGASGGGSGGGATKNRDEYTPQERADMFEKEPAKFKQIFG